MNKILAFLLLSLSTLAVADTVNVNVYGRIRAATEMVSGSGAAGSTKQMRVVDNTSVLGFKGTEDLAQGLQLSWQAEGTIKADGDASGGLNTRNTFVAVKSNAIGTVLGGFYDTPYKQGKKYFSSPVLEDSTAELSALFGKYKSGTGTGSQSFYTRQSSSVQYISPTLGGVEFKLGYAPDESKTSSKNANRISTSISYDNALFGVFGAYESRPDSVTGGGKSKAVLLAGTYKLGTRGALGLGAERITVGGAGQSDLYAAATYKVTDVVTLGATFSKAGKAGSNANSGARAFALGAQYDFSKRTAVTGYYAQINNEASALYNFGASNGVTGLVAGKDPKVIGFGLAHKF